MVHTKEDRIKELTTRQVYYGSSLAVKLEKIDKVFYYKVYAWINQDTIDNKSLIIQNKYDNEDPETLIQMALFEIQAKKVKLGIVKH